MDGAEDDDGDVDRRGREIGRVRHRAALTAVCLAVAVVGLNTTAVGVATRGIATELAIGLGGLEWIVGAYLVTGAAFALVGGRLGDVVGRTRTLIIGTAVMAAGSLLAALSPGAGWLVAARGVQGIGAALVLPASIEVAAAHAPAAGPHRAFRARGIVYATAFGIGPLLGGVLTDGVSWRAVFWTEAALLVVAIAVAVPVLGSSSRLPRVPTRDVLGAALSTVLVLLVVTLASRGRIWGWWSWPTGVLGAGVVLVGAWFLRVEARTPHPLLHRDLVRDRQVLGANAAVLSASVGMIGLVYFFALFAQSALAFDATALRIAVALVPFTVAVAGFSAVSALLGRRFGVEGPVVIGLGLSVAGFALLSRVGVDTTEAQLVIPLVLCGVGAGVANAGLTTPAVMSDHRRVDEAAGLMSLTRFLGSALAVALGTATYLTVATGPHRTGLVDTAADPELTAVGGATYEQAVATLRDDLRRPFEAAAEAGTVEAFAATMRAAAIAVALLALLSTALFAAAARRRTMTPDPAAPPNA